MAKKNGKEKELKEWNKITELIQKNKDEWDKFKKNPKAINKKDWNRISSLTNKTKKEWESYKNK